MVRVVFGFLLISMTSYGSEIEDHQIRPTAPLMCISSKPLPSDKFSIHWIFKEGLRLSTMRADMTVIQSNGRWSKLTMDTINPEHIGVLTFTTPLGTVLFKQLELTLYYQIKGTADIEELSATLSLKTPEETKDLKLLLSKKKRLIIEQAALGPLNESLSTGVRVESL